MKSNAQIAFETRFRSRGDPKWEDQSEQTKKAWRDYVDEQSPCGTETTNNNTERTDSMVYKVALTIKPSALEQQEGKTEQLVMSSVEVTADCQNQAVAKAVVSNIDKLKGVDMGRVTVYVGQQYSS